MDRIVFAERAKTGYTCGAIPAAVSPEVRERLQGRLEPDEKILWSLPVAETTRWAQQAKEVWWFTAILLVGGSACYWWLGSRTLGTVVAIGAIAIGAVILALLLEGHGRKSARTGIYVITNKRAIIVDGMGRQLCWVEETRTYSFGPSDLVKRKITYSRDIFSPKGSGDIVFAEALPPGFESAVDLGGGPDLRQIGFKRLPDVRAVDSLLDQLCAPRDSGGDNAASEGRAFERSKELPGFARRWFVPLCTVGLLVAIIIEGIDAGSDLVFWLRMRDAIQVKGELESVEASGDSADLIGTVATYRYEFGGVTYRGNRVTIHEGADNFGDFQRELFVRLQKAHAKRQSIPVFINPRNPAISTLDRTFRFARVVLPLVFVIAGLVVAVLVIRAAIARTREDQRRQFARRGRPGGP